jgi:hypothetical protein
MKKIKLVSLLVLALCVSCGERYKETKGPSFEGTWTLLESYTDTVRVPIHNGKFLIAREFDGENLLLFYSGGYYDSSFFFRIQDNNLFVRKVLDLVNVIEYYMVDSKGDTIKDPQSGHAVIYRATDDNNLQLNRDNIRIIDTIVEPQKPLHPRTGYSPEKYYGTLSFGTGAHMTMTVDRRKVNENGAPTTDSYGRDVYFRPVDKE